MSRRWAKMVFSRSPAVFNSIQSNRCFLPKPSRFHPFKNRRLNFCSTNSSSSSSEDDLNGLIDPDFSIMSNGASVSPQRENRGGESVSAEDFAFLNDAVLDYDAADVNSSSCKYSDEAISISNAVRDIGADFDVGTEKFLRQFRDKLDDSLVTDVLKLLVKSPESGVRFFIWAGRQIGYRHSGPAYDALLDILGFGRSSRIPEHFLREISEEDPEILGKLLNVLIQKCCRNGFWNEALEELGRLKDFGYKPSKTTYSALIQVLLKADRLDSAFLVHREMSELGFSMDGFTMGYFARSLCKAGRWREALGIIEKEDFVPDTVIYTKMISGLCEASLFEEAMAFLNRMRSNSCIPNVVTYTKLLDGLLRKRQLGRCKRVLSTMITEGCNPSPSLFNSLVNAYCSSGDYSYAYKLLKKMVGCGCPPGYVTYNILIGGICGNEDLPSSDVLELAEKAYAEMLDAGIVLNKVNVGHFARCLCSVGKFEKAFTVIREMMSRGFIPDSSTYSKVISFLCQACKVEKAFHLFEDMKKNALVPDVYTYTILIDSFCKVGLIQQARNLFNEMVRDGCAPNVVTFTALIHAYLKARRLSEANELFESMLTLGCTPNVVTYTALIDGHCKAGELEKACQIYARMRGSRDVPDVDMYFEGDASSNTEPNIFTYGALVDGLCKAHKVVEAHDLLDGMSVAGCEPNHVVYDALIDGFCKVGKLDEAQEVFVKMSERGYSPNVYTYSSLIDRLFKDKRLDLALKVLSKMLENSIVPNVVTYTEMIDGLCKVGKTDEAYKLLVMMEGKGCHPNVVTYTAIIDGFGKVGKVDMCLDLLRQMTGKGCAPNFITYRILINHCCASGLLDEAHKLLEEMKHTYWPKYVAGYRNVIQGFNREFLVSLGLLEEISKYDSVPLVPAYNILIDSLCKVGRLEEALALHKEISTSSSVCLPIVGKNMYCSLIESLCLACKVQKAFELYSDMTRRGYIPELSLFVSLVKGLIRVNRWDIALQLSDSIYRMDIHWHSKEEAFEGS
ncbi:pentatricopeptide repeat-containing protein At1g06710, mitochondrial isoform X2 [Magnolia sinica]|uniref:pentatricopeptide repeat-containing protein At1g06710, mitochondrial isoform X2 n=1 Tax=Magnolia sinica TaxID=86752 RepID=UPI00265AB7F0|nr:pentatricopeptide repeat-containing protein At1g06710, mitochondrial isoform X2 [Magnolia sinica]